MTDYLGVIIDDVVRICSLPLNASNVNQEIEEYVYDSKKCPYVTPESIPTLRTLDVCSYPRESLRSA